MQPGKQMEDWGWQLKMSMIRSEIYNAPMESKNDHQLIAGHMRMMRQRAETGEPIMRGRLNTEPVTE